MKYLFALLLVGCAHGVAHPQLDPSAQGAVLFGDPIVIHGWWTSSDCHRHYSSGQSGDGWVALFAMEPKHPGTSGSWQVDCGELASHIKVECSEACDVGHPISGGLSILEKQPGPIDVRATVTRDDTGEAHVEVFHYVVAMPDEVQLACGSSSPCGPDGIDAAHPIVRPYVMTPVPHGAVELLRVNGRPPHAHDEISLADLYPEARTSDGGIEPGSYRVVVSFLDMSSTFQVVAR
jgi:hypothetical protein